MNSALRQPVIELISSIDAHLHEHRNQHPFIQMVLDRLSETSIKQENLIDQSPAKVPHLENALSAALGNTAQHHSVHKIGQAINAANAGLPWKVDNGIYYEGDSKVGESYIQGNMHCELIGSDKSFFQIPDFTLGLFLLARHTNYLDHCHAAPEFYLTLTGPTQWRFNRENWRDLPAGSMLWNEPFKAHATRTGDIPFLSVYCWTKDIDHKCQVVET